MPQCRNWRLATDFVPNGKGSIFNNLIDISVTTRKRAERMNEGELTKYDARARRIDKHSHLMEHRQTNTMSRINRTLAEMTAYREVVNEQFTADKFDTLKWGYRLKEAKKDPSRFQRFIYETRIYHSGFSKRTLRRHVDSKIKTLDPENVRKEAKDKRIKDLKSRTMQYEVDRSARSLTVILDDFNQKKDRHESTLKSVREEREIGLSQFSDDVQYEEGVEHEENERE